MIKNKKDLLKGISLPIAKRRRVLLDIVEKVLMQIQPAYLCRGIFLKKKLKEFEKIAVIGIGKAAKQMAKTLLPQFPRKPDFLLLADSGHPLPTKKGLINTQKIMSAARSLGERDIAIVLISGGGSSMLVAPVPEITLGDKIKTTSALLRCGATIHEINVVRKHLSLVKGGNLAALLYPAAVLGFVISDVVGNDLSTIASGPLSPDPSTFADALEIVKKYKVSLPPRVIKYLKKGSNETPKPGEKYFNETSLRILADHSTVAEKAFLEAKKRKLKPKIISTKLNGEAREAARKIINFSGRELNRGLGRKLGNKNNLFIATGETTVTCRGKGYGGRNQELVLSGLRYLKPDQTLLAIGTDGVDGICPEPIAGAIADEAIMGRGLIEKSLNNNDSYGFFKKTRGLIKTGSTGTNIGDLILFIDNSRQ